MGISRCSAMGTAVQFPCLVSDLVMRVMLAMLSINSVLKGLLTGSGSMTLLKLEISESILFGILT